MRPKKVINGYKGFNPDLSCRGFQYKVGKEYQCEDAVICEEGFHFCENPFSVFRYYPPSCQYGLNRFCKVQGSGDFDLAESDKVCCTEIKIEKVISLRELINAEIGLIIDKMSQTEGNKSDKAEPFDYNLYSAKCGYEDYSTTSNSDNASFAVSSGDGSLAGNEGEKSIAANTGDNSLANVTDLFSVAANTGESSVSVGQGDKSVSANTGKFSAAAAKGSRTITATTNEKSVSLTTYEMSIAASTGWFSASVGMEDKSIASSTGYSSTAKCTGEQSSATNTGGFSLAGNDGISSTATNTGEYSSAKNTGDYSISSCTGKASQAINEGEDSIAANTGMMSLAVVKNCGTAVVMGHNSAAKAESQEAIAIAAGKDCRAKGTLNSWLVLTERDEWNGDCYPIKDIKVVKVDGKRIKPDTYYELTNGEVVVSPRYE